jgi:hypothetical protein
MAALKVLVNEVIAPMVRQWTGAAVQPQQTTGGPVLQVQKKES